jgi:hypothetical protein
LTTSKDGLKSIIYMNKQQGFNSRFGGQFTLARLLARALAFPERNLLYTVIMFKNIV